MNFRRLLIVLSVPPFLAGCLQPDKSESRPSQASFGDCEADFATVWDTALDVLREQRFPVDRTDVRHGQISTRPVGSQHLFEFWRSDVATSEDLWESTLNSIRRRASLKIDERADGSGCHVTVQVHKERKSIPERQVNNSASAFHLFRYTIPSASTGDPVTAADIVWLPAGRDGALERKILERIVMQVGGPSSGSSSSVASGE